jgi:hypothetical protein
MPEADPLLVSIIRLGVCASNSTEGRAQEAITLLVHGLLVSGFIIPARQFMLSDDLPSELLEKIDYLDKTEPLPPGENPEPEDPVYVHLSNVRFALPGHVLTSRNSEKSFWRGRIADVSGFSLYLLGDAPGTKEEPPSE